MQGFNIFTARTQEIEEFNIPVLQGLLNTKQNCVFLCALHSARCYAISNSGKCTNRMLSIIIIPWDPVIVEKREEFLPVLQ